jgi:hypothetical protein
VSVEPERDAGKESDLVVRGFDEPLGEAGVECDVDRFSVCVDPVGAENWSAARDLGFRAGVSGTCWAPRAVWVLNG